MPRNKSAGGVAIANSRQKDSLSLAKAFDPSRPARPSPLASSTIRGIPLDLVERIRSFSFFTEAPEDFLIAIGSCLRMQVHAAQESIIDEGEDSKAMYWLIRGSVVVTSRDRESVYAELPPGALFGEIGIMMNVPRTASVIARSKCLVARLNKEDLQKILPDYPKVEQAIREEAAERLAILRRRKMTVPPQECDPGDLPPRRPSKRGHEEVEMEVEGPDERGDGTARRGSNKRLKSPSPTLITDPGFLSPLNNGAVNIRQLLRKQPLFAELPDSFLHFLGLNAEAKTYRPFKTILKEGTSGRDVFFITEGTVEIFTEHDDHDGALDADQEGVSIRARLHSGQFFGEVTSLSLAHKRTASVRTVNTVECLVINGDVIDELWKTCPIDLRQKVEETARERLEENAGRELAFADHSSFVTGARKDSDIAMLDVSKPEQMTTTSGSPTFSIAFRDVSYEHMSATSPTSAEPYDPDPFLNKERSARRPGLSRRSSHQNSVPEEASPLARDDPKKMRQREALENSTPSHAQSIARPRLPSSVMSIDEERGPLPDKVLVIVLQNLNFVQLLRARQVCSHWRKVITRSPELFHDLNLGAYNRVITDDVLIDVVAPFVGDRARSIDLSNCFHVTDDGFSALVTSCGDNLIHLRMKSVWEISPNSIIQMANKAPNLASLDFSNCRKVSDSLLARVVGWVARTQTSPQHSTHLKHGLAPLQTSLAASGAATVGCQNLRRLTLSYCKHVTDRFMQHLAYHASTRLEEMDLTRCTTISDVGFRHWADRPFPRLRKLVLADCTYLSDAAIGYLTNSARCLEELDLSFCCALSDASVERVAAALPRMKRLDLAFCGSAVSDGSMAAIGRGLRELQILSVRGCVRVTRQGVDAVLKGSRAMKVFDVSQCRNLIMEERWVTTGVKFNTVADGKWRVGT